MSGKEGRGWEECGLLRSGVDTLFEFFAFCIQEVVFEKHRRGLPIYKPLEEVGGFGVAAKSCTVCYFLLQIGSTLRRTKRTEATDAGSVTRGSSLASTSDVDSTHNVFGDSDNSEFAAADEASGFKYGGVARCVQDGWLFAPKAGRSGENEEERDFDVSKVGRGPAKTAKMLHFL